MIDTIIISCVQLQRNFDQFRGAFEARQIRVIMPPVVQALSEAELLDLVPGVAGIIAGDDELTEAVLERADRLRVISKWGVGTDGIDRQAADRLGIRVTNTPGVFSDEVADVVVGYLMMLARRLHLIDRGVHAGDWPKPEGVSLGGRTLGIIGLGDIGQALAIRATAIGMRVIGTDVDAAKMEAAARTGLEAVALSKVLNESDAVSLNCPLTPATRRMIDARALAQMKPGSWLINTARGGLVDEPALIEAIRSGQIGAAALDVFEIEPLPASSSLLELDQVILGSHNASNTTEAIGRTSALAIDNLLQGLRDVAR